MNFPLYQLDAFGGPTAKVLAIVLGILFGVAPTEPKILAGAVVVMAGAALAGCIAPIRRAGRVDPVTILRAE